MWFLPCTWRQESRRRVNQGLLAGAFYLPHSDDELPVFSGDQELSVTLLPRSAKGTSF
jgi:hypothetical protein